MESKMNDEASFLSSISELFAGAGIPLLLSLAASFVRFSRYSWQSWRHFFASLLTSIFVGQVVFWGLDFFALEPSVDAAIVSLSAYMGGSLIDAIAFRVRKEIRDGGGLPPPPRVGR